MPAPMTHTSARVSAMSGGKSGTGTSIQGDREWSGAFMALGRRFLREVDDRVLASPPPKWPNGATTGWFSMPRKKSTNVPAPQNDPINPAVNPAVEPHD